MRKLFLLLLFCGSSWLLPATESITVNFYGQSVVLDYDPAMVFKWRICAKDRCIKDFYRKLDESGAYQPLLEDLQAAQKRFELNDWLYYQLVRKAAEKIYGDVKTDKEEMPETTAAWFLLIKSGYKVDLCNAALKHLFILAPSKKKLNGISRSSMQKGWYAYNISAHYQKLDASLAALTMNKFDPSSEDARPLDLSFQKHPKFNNPTITKTFELKHKDTAYLLTVRIDTMIRQYMKRHPQMAQEAYMSLPLSDALAQSLIPQLQEILKGKSEEEAMSILLSFTRRSFPYKWDWDVYDEDHPMIADLVFLEPYSDHEDKSALFCYLVRELYGYQMAVISHFNFDITIGVALKNPVGSPYTIDGVDYTICDPTSPTNSGKVGRYPNGFTDKTAQLLTVLEAQTPGSPVAVLTIEGENPVRLSSRVSGTKEAWEKTANGGSELTQGKEKGNAGEPGQK